MFPIIRPATGACVLAAALAAVAGPTAHGQIINPPGGTTVTWTDDALNGDWQDSDNWNVDVPEDGDAVIIDDGHHNVVLHADAATIRSLFVAGGIGLYNFGHRLPVANDDGDATTTITGNGSTIIVSDIPGTGPALDTDYLELQNGGEFDMDGGRAQIDHEVNMSGAVEVSGHGVLEVGGGGDAALGFSSTSELTPEGGNLRIDMTGGGTIALGGAYIDVTDDDSDLILDGHQFGPIGDTLRIGNDNTVDFEGPWELTGTLQFVSGGGVLVGGSGEIVGDVSVSSSASARISSNAEFTGSATTSVSSFASLELTGHVTSAAGHATTLATASTLRLQLPPSNFPNPLPTIVWNGDISASSANIEVNQPILPSQPGLVYFAGDMTLGGSEFFGPTDLQGSAPIYLTGNLTVEDAGARVNGVGMQFTSSSQTTVEGGSSLEVMSTARINEGASFGGSGELRVAASGLLFGEDDSVVGVDVVNNGIVRPGSGSDYSAQFEFAESYLQTGVGALEIDLAGSLSSQYDRLVVGEGADLNGALAVTLRNGFEPALGDDFLILSAGDGVNGSFASTLLPALDDGLDWDIDYSPFAVTLSVVEQTPTGDANGDGIIDGADFLVIQQDFGLMGPSAGDVTGDGVVSGDDFNLWTQQFGTAVEGAVASVAAASHAVPEPGAGTLAMGLTVAASACAKRRRLA